MKQVDYWVWAITDEVTGKRRRTKWRMSEAEARAAYPDAEQVPGTLEVRLLPATPKELADRLPGRPRGPDAAAVPPTTADR